MSDLRLPPPPNTSLRCLVTGAFPGLGCPSIPNPSKMWATGLPPSALWCPGSPFPTERRACNGTELAENLEGKGKKKQEKNVCVSRSDTGTRVCAGAGASSSSSATGDFGQHLWSPLLVTKPQPKAYLQDIHGHHCSSLGEVIITKSLNQTKSSFRPHLTLPPPLSTLQLLLSFLRDMIRVSLEVGELLASLAFATYISYCCCASKAG